MTDPGHVRTFNRIADRYDEKFGKDCEVAHEIVLRWAADTGANPDVVLDIGCGTGRLLASAMQRWPAASVHGVDPAVRMIEVAAQRIPTADLRVATAEHLPYADASVDLILSTTSFGHWSDAQAGLQEVRRVLRPGGSCLIAEHAPPGLVMMLVLTLLRRMPRLYDTDALRQIVDDAGLLSERVEVTAGTFVAVHARRMS